MSSLGHQLEECLDGFDTTIQEEYILEHDLDQLLEIIIEKKDDPDFLSEDARYAAYYILSRDKVHINTLTS